MELLENFQRFSHPRVVLLHRIMCAAQRRLQNLLVPQCFIIFILWCDVFLVKNSFVLFFLASALSLGLQGGVLLAVPVPEKHAATGQQIEEAIQVAVIEARYSKACNYQILI